MNVTGDNASGHGGYALGHSDRELDRLSAQAHLVDPITRQFFREADTSAKHKGLLVPGGRAWVGLLGGFGGIPATSVV